MKESCHANALLLIGTLSLWGTFGIAKKLHNLCNTSIVFVLMMDAMLGEETDKASVNAIRHPVNSDDCVFDTIICIIDSKEKKRWWDMKNWRKQKWKKLMKTKAETKNLPFTIWRVRNRTAVLSCSAAPQTLWASQARPCPLASMPTISTSGSSV